MSLSILLWIGIDFLIDFIMTILLGATGGFGIAWGFDIYRKLKTKLNGISRKETIRSLVNEHFK